MKGTEQILKTDGGRKARSQVCCWKKWLGRLFKVLLENGTAKRLVSNLYMNMRKRWYRGLYKEGVDMQCCLCIVHCDELTCQWTEKRVEAKQRECVVLGFCYMFHSQEEKEINEYFFTKLEESWHTLVFHSNVNHFWQRNLMGCKQSWRFLDCADDKVLMQVMDEFTGEVVVLVL